MSSPSLEFYAALGHLGYAFGIADGDLTEDEADIFVDVMLKAFGNMPNDKRGRKAVEAFAHSKARHQTADEAYVMAMNEFKNLGYEVAYHFDKIMNVVEEIIESDNVIALGERQLRERFMADTKTFLEEHPKESFDKD